MANMHILGNTEIDDSGITLNTIKNSKIIDTSSSNYIKFKDGTLICYGSVTCNIYANPNYISGYSKFPIAFKNTPTVVVTRNINDNSYDDTTRAVKVINPTKTDFNVYIGSNNGSFKSGNSIPVNYIAIGK